MGSRRTYDTEMITVRQIYAYNSNNSIIPANRVLSTDGRGGTYWATVSTVGGIPAFNEVVANGSSIVADEPYNRLILSTSEGLGMVRNTTTNEVRFYSKGFTQIDVSGGNTLVGYSNNTVTPVIKMEGKGGVRVSADPLTNTLFIQGVPTAISTASYAFGQVNVISNASTITPGAFGNSNRAVLTATDPSSIYSVIGVGDILLNTNTTSNGYFIGISTFTSKGYLELSSIAFNAYASTLSTVSSLFYDIPKTGYATSSLKNLMVEISTGINSNLTYFRTYVLDNFTTLNYFGLNSTATGNVITGIQQDINYIYIQLGTIDIGNIRNISTATGSNGEYISTSKKQTSTSLLQVSSLAVNCNAAQYEVDINGTLNATNIRGYPSQINLNSTITGLGSSGYISTSGIESTVIGLGTSGYISTLSLQSTIEGLGGIGYISTGGLVSTVKGLGESGYISTNSLYSTIEGLGSIGYISTQELQATVDGLGGIGYISTTGLDKKITELGTLGYVSSLSLGSTIDGLGSVGWVSTLALLSVMMGLGSYGYISTGGLLSSLGGLGELGYISTSQLNSTVKGLGTSGYISTLSLESTVRGLGESGYISTLNLESTVRGLGSSGYISTLSLESTVRGLGSSGYISTLNLESTVRGLGSSGYISTLNLESTVRGLGSSGYISTLSLESTVRGLGSSGYISTNINFFSTLAPLPIDTLGALVGCNIMLSSATFRVDSMSSMIQQGATGYIRINPTFRFDSNTSGAYVSAIDTSIYIGTTPINNTTFTRSWVPGNTTNYNVYGDTIQIELDNGILLSNIQDEYRVCHNFGRLDSPILNYHITSQTNSFSIHFCSPR